MSDNENNNSSNNNTALAPVVERGEQAIEKLKAIGWTSDGGAQLTSAADAWRLAQIVAQSGMYPGTDTPQKAMVKAQTGAELGFSFNASMQNIHMIEGRPVLGAALQLAAILRSKLGRYRFAEMNDKVCRIVWQRKFDDEWLEIGESSWTIEEARVAGLDNRMPWKKTPADMLRARAVGRGARSFFPDLLMGALTDDEAEDVKEARALPQPGEAPVRGNAAVTAALGAPEVLPPKDPPKRSQKAKEQPAETTPAVTPPAPPPPPPAAPPAQPPQPSPSPTTEAPGPTSEQPAPMPSSISTSEPDASPAHQSPPTTPSDSASSPPASPTSTPTATGEALDDDGLNDGDELDDTPVRADLRSAVLQLKPGTGKEMSAQIAVWQEKLSPDDYAALRALALAINNKNKGVPADAGFDDEKKAALARAREIAGNPLDG